MIRFQVALVVRHTSPFKALTVPFQSAKEQDPLPLTSLSSCHFHLSRTSAIFLLAACFLLLASCYSLLLLLLYAYTLQHGSTKEHRRKAKKIKDREEKEALATKTADMRVLQAIMDHIPDPVDKVGRCIQS
jgi:hypothetical protein